jgi:hypothetical protein
LDFKSELATSQAKMQTEIKEQLDDFIATFAKLHTSISPPNTKGPESIASHVEVEDFQLMLGEKTPSHPFSYTASPQSHLHTSKPPPPPPPNTKHQTSLHYIAPSYGMYVWHASDNNNLGQFLPYTTKHYTVLPTPTTIPKQPTLLACHNYPTPQFEPINSGWFGNQACQINGAITHILLVASIIREGSASAPSFTHGRAPESMILIQHQLVCYHS